MFHAIHSEIRCAISSQNKNRASGSGTSAASFQLSLSSLMGSMGSYEIFFSFKRPIASKATKATISSLETAANDLF